MMRSKASRALWAFTLGLLLSPWARAAEESPRALYEAGRYSEAAQAYRSLLERDPQNPWLHYDLGNTQFKSGLSGRATASYLRAFRLLPRDEDIRFNLDFALRRSGESLYPEGTPQALFVAFHALSFDELAGLQWVLFWACLLLISACIVKPAWREPLATPLSILVAAWAAAALWWGARWAVQPASLAVTLSPTTELRNAPNEEASVAFTAPEGRRAEVLEDRGDWIEIGLLKEGGRGWVPKDSIERV